MRQRCAASSVPHSSGLLHRAARDHGLRRIGAATRRLRRQERLVPRRGRQPSRSDRLRGASLRPRDGGELRKRRRRLPHRTVPRPAPAPATGRRSARRGGAEAVGDRAARRGRDQPAGRRRSRRLLAGTDRVGAGRGRHRWFHLASGELSRRRQARHGGARDPADRPPAERRHLSRDPVRKPLRLAARRLPRRRRSAQRDRAQAAGPARSGPAQRAVDPAHRRNAAAAVRRSEAVLPRRAAGGAANAGGLRGHAGHGAPDAVERARRSGRRAHRPLPDLGCGGRRSLPGHGSAGTQRAELHGGHARSGRGVLQPLRAEGRSRRRHAAPRSDRGHAAAGH